MQQSAGVCGHDFGFYSQGRELVSKGCDMCILWRNEYES